MALLYDGPIIDAHHHFWDLSLNRHPWITAPGAGIAALGDIGYLRQNYGVAEYLADTRNQRIVGSVCVEAVWDPTRSPVEETAWFDSLPRPPGIAARYVAAAPLNAPNAADLIAQQAANPRVVAVRETIRWHPDPAKRWTERGLVGNPAWRAGLRHLARHGLALDLLMNPHQAEEVARLAQEAPDQQFIVNHCCTPNDRDAEGLLRWRNGLRLMAAAPNVAIKLSNYGAYVADRTDAALRDVLMTCIDAFGPGRSLFGSDYPVARRTMTFDAAADTFKRIVQAFSPDEQRALFHDTAARLYRFDLGN